MNETVHIFLGRFSTEEEACAYTQEQWEEELDESASDEEHEEWEERNPQWLMRDELTEYLDSDFIETLSGDDRYEYLQGLLVNPGDVDRVRAVDPSANTLVLIFSEALGGFETTMKATTRLAYCGEYACKLGD